MRGEQRVGVARDSIRRVAIRSPQAALTGAGGGAEMSRSREAVDIGLDGSRGLVAGDLLRRVVARADERAGLDMGESHLEADRRRLMNSAGV